MSFKCELPGNIFAAAVRRAAAMTPRGNTVPVLASLLLVGKDGALSISGTDMDQSLTVTLADAGADGGLTAPAATLASIAARLDDERAVTLEESKGKLAIRRGRANWRMPVMPADEYPASVCEPIDGVIWTPDPALLCSYLRALDGAIDPNAMNTYLQGVFFDLACDTPHMVATETRRLGAIAIAALDPPADAPPFILPQEAIRTAAEFEDIADGEAGALTLTLNLNAITLKAAGGRFWTRLIDGKYPDWRKVFPAEHTICLRTEAAAFTAALRNVGALEGDLVQQGKTKVRVNTVNLEYSADEIVASVVNSAGEGATDAAPARLVTGGPGATTLNGANLEWAVTTLPKEGELELRFSEKAPVVITHADDEAGDNRRLIANMYGR
jgi:DNA polymerase-3 subunit beta